MANSTIFDDVFPTIKEKMSERSRVRLQVDEDRIDDLKRIASDTEYRRKLMREMQEDIKEA